MQGYIGNNSSSVAPAGIDSSNDPYLLAKRMTLERQKSLTNPYPYWPGRDAASMVSKTDIVSDSPSPHAKLPPSVTDSLRQPPNSQSAELMSILQGLSDRSSSSMNNGVAGWKNFSVQGGLDPLQNKLDFHHAQSFPPQSAFGIQKQRLPSQNPSLINLLGQTIDNSAGVSTSEKLLSSNLSQDPQLLNMLQQQYLLQAQSQAPVPAQQLLLLDKLLLLKQQQKQEEQQQLLRNQQQLLSQVLSEHHSHQLFNEQSYAQLQTAKPTGSVPADISRLQSSQELFQSGLQIPAPKMQDERTTDLLNLPPHVAQDLSHHAGSEASFVQLPHQMFNPPKSWNANLPEQINDICPKESLAVSKVGESFPSVDAVNNSSQESSLVQKPVIASDSDAPLTDEKMREDTWKADETVGVATAEVTVESLPSEFPEISVVPSAVTCESSVPTPGIANDVKAQPDGAFDGPLVESKKSNYGPSMVTEVKSVEVREVKKASERKSRKQKSTKSHSSEQLKGVSKTSSLQQSKQSETEGPAGDKKFEKNNGAGETHSGTSSQKKRESESVAIVAENTDAQHGKSLLPERISGNDVETVEIKGEAGYVGSVSMPGNQKQAGQRAWKPAPGFKPKSLLEIQQEEQRRVQAEMAVSEITTSVQSMNLSSPWAGVVVNSEPKVSKETHKDVAVTGLNVEKPESSPNTKNKKSQLHDLLAEEVLAKSSEREVEAPNSISGLLGLQNTTIPAESIDDGSFIEAKETKKSRKKSAKAKGAGTTKSSVTTDVPVGTSPIEKGKISRNVQEKEVLPAIPSGPSLGDFVLWKGESANSSSAPAWSTDSKKIAKPTSLRDIQKEQKKVSSAQSQSQISTPQKGQPIQANEGAGLSRSVSASPSKAASTIQINSQAASQLKYKGDDDLFWGPIDQLKKETKQYDCHLFPSCICVFLWCYFLFPVV